MNYPPTRRHIPDDRRTHLPGKLNIIVTSHSFITDKDISMGSPISGTLAEIFLQCIENTHLNQILEEKSVVFFTRHFDVIFIISDTERTSPEKNP
jgi:hypothetical protein